MTLHVHVHVDHDTAHPAKPANETAPEHHCPGTVPVPLEELPDESGNPPS
jgi:hypothetical protein